MPDDWSQGEVEAIVADYFAMWEMDLRGLEYNKAEHNRRLRGLIPERNRSSVEQKHRNISAVLWHLGYPYLRGYKPLPKYQRLLRDVVEGRLAVGADMNGLVAKAVSDPVEAAPLVKPHRPLVVAPPPRREVKELVDDEARRRTNFVRRNYLELEAANQSLGLAGENSFWVLNTNVFGERARRRWLIELSMWHRPKVISLVTTSFPMKQTGANV